MADLQHKQLTTQTIEQLQLPHSLVTALENEQTARQVIQALGELQRYRERWY